MLIDKTVDLLILNFQAKLMSYLTLVQHRPFLICLGVKTSLAHIPFHISCTTSEKKKKSNYLLKSNKKLSKRITESKKSQFALVGEYIRCMIFK